MQFLLVPGQVGSLGEPLIAEFAMVWSLIAMHGILVRYEVIFLTKRFVALLALVWFNLVMHCAHVLI